MGADAAAEIAEGASRLVTAKGKKVQEFRGADTATEEAVAAMLGPTGNLRAPTLRKGKTVIVGFDEETYAALLG